MWLHLVHLVQSVFRRAGHVSQWRDARRMVFFNIVFDVVAHEFLLEEIGHLVVVVFLDHRHGLAMRVDFLKQKCVVVLRVDRQVVELEHQRRFLFEKRIVCRHGGGPCERCHEQVLICI